MATQSYILMRAGALKTIHKMAEKRVLTEREIEAALVTVREAREAYDIERGGDPARGGYPENQEAWRELATEVSILGGMAADHTLKTRCRELLGEMTSDLPAELTPIPGSKMVFKFANPGGPVRGLVGNSLICDEMQDPDL